MTEPVIVYTSACCNGCRRVLDYLTGNGITFETKDVSSDAGAMQELLDLGYMTTPVTLAGDTAVAGFHRKKLDTLLETSGHA